MARWPLHIVPSSRGGAHTPSTYHIPLWPSERRVLIGTPAPVSSRDLVAGDLRERPQLSAARRHACRPPPLSVLATGCRRPKPVGISRSFRRPRREASSLLLRPGNALLDWRSGDHGWGPQRLDRLIFYCSTSHHFSRYLRVRSSYCCHSVTCVLGLSASQCGQGRQCHQ